MRQKIKVFVLLLLSLFFGTLSYKAEEIHFSTNLDNDNVTINPIWEYYESLSSEQKKEWTAVPEKYIVLYPGVAPTLETQKFGSLNASANTMPSSYDLRNVNGINYITPNKNQEELGICWAYASNASLESNILKLGLRSSSNAVIFSERQLDYLSAKPTNNPTITGTNNILAYSEGVNPYASLFGNRALGDGGNFVFASWFMGMGVASQPMNGVWATIDHNYDTISLNDAYNLDNTPYTVTEYVKFPVINNETATSASKTAFREKIKNHLMNYGAVYVSSLAPQNYGSYACYVDDTTDGLGLINWNSSDCGSSSLYPYNGLHAMAIVGWDDNYVESYCALPAQGGALAKYNGTNISETLCKNNNGNYRTVKGAWLLKNSWGNTRDYTHLAYDSLYSEMAGVKTTIERDFDNTYNGIEYGPIWGVYDTTGKVTYTYYKPKDTEMLKRISFETQTTSEITYTAYYTTPTLDKTGSKKYIGTVKTNTPGRYAIDASDIPLDEDSFKIIISPSISSSSYRAQNVFAFTKNEDETERATTILAFDNSFNSTDNTYSYNVYSRVTNIRSGEKISYMLYDSTGKHIPIVNEDRYVTVGAYTGTIKVGSQLNSGLYTVETYHNNVLLGTNLFTPSPSLNGSGTSSDPYIIERESDLNYMFAKETSASYFKLANNLFIENANGALDSTFNSIFTGSLDGANYQISYSMDGDNTGIFDILGGTVTNLKIQPFSRTYYHGGALAAHANRASISNVDVWSGNMEGSIVGGIIGVANNTTITSSYSNVNIFGVTIGSLVGELGDNNTITDSLSAGDIYGNNTSGTNFIGNVTGTGNSMSYLIDLENNDIEESYYKDIDDDILNKTCVNIPTYQQSALSYSEIYYYDSKCDELGTKLTLDALKNSNTFKKFNTTTWSIVNGKYPQLTNIPKRYTEKLSVNQITNLFVGDIIEIPITTTPSNVTDAGYIITTSDESVITVDNWTHELKAVGEGIASFTVKTIDATHLSETIYVYVTDASKKVDISNSFIKVTDNAIDLSELTVNDNTMGITTEISTGSRIGTGSTVTIKKDDTILASYKVVVKGDVSGDGKVGANDILKIRRKILGLDSLDDAQTVASDINGDNNIGANDILKIRRYILGLDGKL